MKQLNAKRFAFIYFTFIILLAISSLFMEPLETSKEPNTVEQSQTTAQNDLSSNTEFNSIN